MSKKVTKIAALLLIVVMAMGLTGCSLFQDFDSSGYVESTLDAAFKGEFKKYAELTESTEAEAEADYNSIVDAYLSEMVYGLDLTDAQYDEFRELVVKHLKNAKYKVKEAEKVDSSTFKVDVVVSPLEPIDSLMNEYQEDIEVRMGEGEFDDMEYDELIEMMAGDILELYKGYVNNPDYAEDVTYTMNVKLDGSLYTIDESEFTALTSAIFNQ